MSQILIDNKLTPDQQYYRNYNLFKSTAWIIPILFIYITQQKSITNEQIIYVAGLFSLLPFIIEIPFGILADKIGTKNILALGILFQILSCMSLILVPSHVSYHFYLICINFASAMFSGADQSFVRNLFSDQESFKTYLHENNGLFYRNSIFMLIIGTFLYQMNPYMPFIVQMVSFFISLNNLMKIRFNHRLIDHKKIKLIDHLFLSLKIILNNNKLKSLILMSSVFDLSISLNHKIIQQQITSLVPFKLFSLLGITYVLGNLSSYYGSKLFIKMKSKIQVQILVPLFLMLISYFLLSIDNLFFIIAGFIFLCGFKSIYRPLCDGEMTLQIPTPSTRATVLSIVSILSAVLSLSYSVILAKEYATSFFNGNIYFLIYTFPLLIIGVYLFFKKNIVELPLVHTGFSGKEHFLIKDDKSYDFLHKAYYPKSVNYDELNLMNLVLKYKPYNASQIVIEECSQTGLLYTLQPYYGELHMWQVDEEFQKTILTQLFSCRVSIDFIEYDLPYALVEKPSEIFLNQRNLKIIESITDQSVIHGDLHPDNILIHNSTAKVIDWDLSGVGPFWFDALTILTSPKLLFQINYRISMFSNYFKIDEINTSQIFIEFIIYKIKSLEKLSNENTEIDSLVNNYKSILSELESSYG